VRNISRRPSPSPRVYTDVRSLARSYADVITKFSQLDGLPIFLTYGASLARFARWNSAIIWNRCLLIALNVARIQLGVSSKPRATTIYIRVVVDLKYFTISNWFENHQPQKTQLPTVTDAPFIQNLVHGLQYQTQPQVFRGYFFNCTPVKNIQENIQAFKLTELLWKQKLTWLISSF